MMVVGLSSKEKLLRTRGKTDNPETRFTEFPALSVDPGIGISRSALETDGWLVVLGLTAL